MKFTIRDWLWLTVVVALALCWWADRSRLGELANLYSAITSYRISTGDYPPDSSAPAAYLTSD